MAQQVRIDEATHAKLRELADKDEISMQEELARAVEAWRRQRFFAEMAAGFAALTPEERAEDAAELALWEGTLLDGLEDE